MALKTIISVCEDVHAKLLDPKLFFAHGDREWQNIIVDQVVNETETLSVMQQERILYVDEPIKSNDTITANHRIIPSYPLTFVFGGKTELDWEPARHQTVIAEMRDLARKYVLLLLQEQDTFDRKIFSEVSGMSRTDFINLFDANMSGTYLQLTLKPLTPESICV